MNTFEELNVWKKAREIRKEVRAVVNKFPKEEKFELAAQLVRASRSIGANIAEGYGRFHYQDNVRYCRIARGSLMEVLEHLIVAMDEGYISEEKLNAFKTEILLCNKILSGYICYLLKNKAEVQFSTKSKFGFQSNNIPQTTT
ncbi:MAG: four helix bundle protein [Bacteroidia bacterium]|nr:four helix bundle protein [Bacteroidia bacterium]